LNSDEMLNFTALPCSVKKYAKLTSLE